jgi:lysosomal Pro-X carboxypeptidase
MFTHILWTPRADTFWSKRPNAPFLFYSGNEGDIFMFYNNTGYLFDLAEMYGAYVVFAEHRYYGMNLAVQLL